MKLLSKQIVKEGPGWAKLVPEEGEDLWHAYNLIREGDRVEATTLRKVQTDRGTGTESERVKLKLQVAVAAVEYDSEGQQIRLKGRNLTENEHVKLGAYHTLELELHRAFTLTKDVWDSVDVERVRSACDPAASADLAVLLITEGLAHLCLVGSTCTLTRAKIEASVPRKRGAAAAGYDKAMESFYDKCFAAVQRHVDWDIVRCLVVAGPGFAKEQFKEYLDKEAQRREARPLLLNRSKILLAPASSAYKHSIKEVLASSAVAGQIKDTKAAKEVQALADFMSMLGHDSARAFYGPGHVKAAHELGAVQTLLITDSLFRTSDVQRRKKIVALTDEVAAGGLRRWLARACARVAGAVGCAAGPAPAPEPAPPAAGAGGGTVLVFSGMHASGEQLNQLTGVAAILRFPLPDLEEEEFEAEW